MSTDAPRPGPIAISALGASTCFGGMTTAAAAARAGLSRSRALPDLTYIDGETKEKTPFNGAPIVGVTDGFEGAGRLARMSQVALDELTAAAAWVNPRRMACFLSLPPIPEDAARRVAAAVATSLGSSPDLVRVHASGHAGTARSLQDAAETLRSGRCDHAIVGACDSWLDGDRLQEMADQGRLKSRNAPVGFTPGEAAVFLLLERPGAAGGGREAPAALLADVQADMEENVPASGKPSTGRATARAVIAALRSSGKGTLYADLNGEPHRAVDWGMATTRLKGTAVLDGWAREHPAASFGDTGTAGPVLAAGLSARAFARGYAVGERALVLSIGDGGERIVLLVEKPRDGGRGARG